MLIPQLGHDYTTIFGTGVFHGVPTSERNDDNSSEFPKIYGELASGTKPKKKVDYLLVTYTSIDS